MSESVNALPVQTYVRTRTSTIVRSPAGQASGAITLNLDRPADVTLIVLSDPAEGVPAFVAAAIGRTPTMTDFDVILSPTAQDEVKPPHAVTLHVPAMQSDLRWAGFGPDAGSQAFGGGSISRLIVAIDQ